MDLRPDPAAMQILLDLLFGNAADGRIELAWTDAKDHKLRHARTFDLDCVDDLIEEAVKANEIEGQNVYIGAALRKTDTPPFGRCNDEDFLVATAFWCDLDDGAAVASASEKYNGAPPTIAVLTGRKPHPRAQLWWRQETPCTDPEKLKERNAAVALALGGDPSVVNPSRVMRLAGSIAWPTKPGREVELTKLVTFKDNRPRCYVDGQFDRAYPPALAPNTTPITRGTGLSLNTGVDPAQILREAKPGNWHNAMRAFTAHCVAADYPDWIIIEAARQVLDDPTDPSDVVKLIRGARQKFDIPDAAIEQAESAPLRAVGLQSFIKLDLPERKMLFGPWLPEQGLVMAFSETGMGKTYFALNVAYAVATDGEYLGWQATEQQRVLYLDGEMPARTM